MLARLVICGALVLAAGQAASSPVHPIAIAGDDFSDLAFLKTALKDVRIVQLGENGHGEAESMRSRERIARFLHREMGFSTLAFESSLFVCHLADERADKAEPQRTLTSSVIGVWHTQEMLPLFTYVRETRGTGHPLRLAGFDVQPIGGNRKQRPAFFSDVVSAVDTQYAQEVLALDRDFFAAYDKGSSARREQLRVSGASLAAGFDRLSAFLEKNLVALQRLKGRNAPLIAMQEARSAAAYIRFQTAPDMRQYAEGRDRGMFENLRFLAERLFPGEKIIVWGHNFHVRHDNASIPPSDDIFPGVRTRTMGTWTREHFGRQVFTIGQYEFEGEAVDNGRKPYPIAPASAGSLEHALNDLAKGRPSIVLLRDQAPGWAALPAVARYNGQHPERLSPDQQYDALLFLPKVRPPTFLY